MKKITTLLVLLFVMFLPLYVNAESKYLYDVLKNEAEKENGLAKEYTGEHHDSFTKEPTHKIYHWYADNDEEMNNIDDKNNIIFGGYCWKMFRTTDTGGIKLVYNGFPRNNNCVDYSGNSDMEIGNLIWVSVADFFYFSTDFDIDSNTKKFVAKGDVKKGSELTNKLGRYMFQTMDLNEAKSSIYYMIGDHLGIAFYSNYGLNNSIGTNDINSNFPETLSNIGYLNGNKYPISNMYADETNNYSTSSNTFGYSDSYEFRDGYYYLQNPIMMQYKDIKDNIEFLKGKYSCFNSSNNCNVLSYVQGGNETNYTKVNVALNKYTYYKNANYSDGKYHLSGGSISFEDIKNNLNLWDQFGFFCNDGTAECENVSYIYNLSETQSMGRTYHHMNSILLTGGDKPSDVIENITSDNSGDSYTKKVMDLWYQRYFNGQSNNLEDVIYCNNRQLDSKGNLDETGTITDEIVIKPNMSLKCPRIKDSLSVSNEEAKLDYPVGLMNLAEASMMGNLDGSYQSSFLMDAYGIGKNISFNEIIYEYPSYKTKLGTGSRNKLKPVVALKKDSTYSSGLGTKENPYIFDKIVSRYKINVEIENKTEDFNVNINDMSQVEYNEEVSFKVTPIKGYKVTDLKIIDSDNNEIDYEMIDNRNYKFIMPASDVTIMPSYEKVKNSVTVVDNKNTKELIIEVNDSKAVMYEDTVRFRVTPEEGYEVDKIDITDEEKNKIKYKNTTVKNEYEFKMPDTDVTIDPTYRKIDTNNINNNPNTSRNIFYIILVIICIATSYIFIRKRKHKF